MVACSPPIRRAEQALKAGKYQQAEKLLEQATEDPESVKEAKPLLALTHFHTQGFKVALEELQALDKTERDERNYQRTVREIQKALKQLDTLAQNPDPAALRSMLSAYRQDPFLAERLQWLLYLNSNRTDLNLIRPLEQSEDPLIQQLVLWEEARQTPEKFTELLERFPHSPFRARWYQSLLERYESKELPKEAQNLLIRWKNELSDQSDLKAEILLKQAEFNLVDHPNAALNYYLTYLRLFPKHRAGHKTLYTIREKLGDKLAPQDHLLLAEAAYQRYMYQTAYSELSQVPPKTAQEYYRLGTYALKAKYYREAREAFETLRQRYKNTTEAGLAGVALASLHRNAKAYSTALQTLEAVKTAYASQKQVMAAALWEQGLVYDLQNQAEQRAKVCLQLAQKMPTDEQAMPALWQAVWFAYRQHDYARVITLLENNKRNYEGHELASRFKYWLARAYEESDDPQHAQRLYQDLVKRPLMDYYSHRARERLRILQHGGADQYATKPYKGYQTHSIPHPGYAEAFQSALNGTSDGFSPLRELYYLHQLDDFMFLAQYSEDPEIQVLHGLELQRQGRDYEAVTRYRYPAEKDDRYLPAAFPLSYFPQIEAEAKKYGLNPFLVSGLIWQESQYKPDIQSWVGATGLMQIMPATAEQIAGKLALQNYDLTQPQNNIQMGTWYLHDRHELFNNNSLLAVASYNAGAGPVNRWLKDYGDLDNDALAESITYPETRGYVKHVFTAYWIYQQLYGR